MTHETSKASKLKRIGLACLAGTVLATGLTVSAMANDDRQGARERDGERSGSAFRAGERFARADVDGDRMISLSEFQAGATARFSSMDADGDGLVTAEEIVAQRERARESRVERMIERVDANADGAISQEEMAAASEERFARMDRNDDGSLEPREMRRGERRGPGGGDRSRPMPTDEGVTEQSL